MQRPQQQAEYERVATQPRTVHSSNDKPPKASRDELAVAEAHLTPEQMRRYQALNQLLESWCEEDEQEQRDTLEYLKRVLDEDRLSDRKLFP